MKILFVINDYSFFKTHRLPIAKACQKKGWKVHIATPKQDKSTKTAKGEGLIWHGIPMDPGSQNPMKDWKTLRALTNCYQQIQPDLVHHVTVKAVLYGSIAARRAGVPAVVNALSGLGYLYINNSLKNRVIRLAISPLFRYGFRHPNQRLILQNEDDKHMVLDYNLLEEEAITIIRGSGVNTQKFDYTPETNSDVKVVLPARMLWDKGVREFVEAAQRIDSQGLNVSFHLLGDTDPKNPKSIPEEQLWKWNADSCIHYEGFQDDMVTVLQDANIVCLPSYREGLPKVLLEAASVGRPIVTTNAPGCREVVEDGVNGYLVPVKNSRLLTQRILELIDKPELRKEFGKKGREKVVQELSLEKVIQQTLGVYETLLEN